MVKRLLAREKEEERTVENDVELARMDVCVIKYRVWGSFVGQK